MKRLFAVSLLSLFVGCAFNLEEEQLTLSWTRDLTGMETIVLDDAAFEGSDVSVSGVDGDSLQFSCDVRLLTTGDEAVGEDLDLRAHRDSGVVTLSLLTSGDDWVRYQLGDVDIVAGRDLAYEISVSSGDISVDGVRGYVKAVTESGDVDVETSRGANIEAEGEITVTLQPDSADPTLSTLFEGVEVDGARERVLVNVVPGLRVELDLQSSSGTIEVLGEEVDGDDYSGMLNGGGDSQIRVTTTSGDISIVLVQMP